jgi:glycosyltransferase involved in cell wall biosynthesis
MKILQICFRVPYPPHDGGAIAMYSLTKGLSQQGHEVTILAFNTPKHFDNGEALIKYAEVHTVFVNTSVSVFKLALNFFKEVPYNLERFISDKFEKELVNILSKERFDIIHFEGMYVAWYVEAARRVSTVPMVLRTHNLEYQIWERYSYSEKNRLKKMYFKYLSDKLRKFEKKYFSKFDAIASISPQDANAIKVSGNLKFVEHIPFGIDREEIKQNIPLEYKPYTICVISALEWLPNLEGLKWFLQNVWPELYQNNPELELHIAGKRTPQEILNLKLQNVFIHGFVPDAYEFMRKYDLMIVPLLSGSGTRIKILEGMAIGKCIVTSRVGAEGMEYENNKNLLIANTSEEWTQLIESYFKNKSNFNSIGQNAFQLIKEKYDNKNIISKLIDLYKRLQ